MAGGNVRCDYCNKKCGSLEEKLTHEQTCPKRK